jgi:hypothetical protein
MIPTPRALEKRLQDRYHRLVQEHLGQAKATAPGLRALPAETSAFAATQAAWRFWNNPRVSLPALAQPLLDCAADAAARDCHRYVLVIHDWSHLDYLSHRSKADWLRGSNDREIGYDAHVALAVSDRDGRPLAPVYQGLGARDGLHDSRRAEPAPPESKLDRLESVFAFVRAQGWDRPAVHIIDREADSLAHLRAWQQGGHSFLVRADTERRVRHEGQERPLRAVVADLEARGAFAFSRDVEYHGRPARQEVAEATVVLDRAAFRQRVVDGQRQRQRVRGAALALRLVVSRVYDAGGALLAEWLLWSNVPAEVAAAELALWYYWRWRIESYFKLLKGAGLEVEHWQQETAAAIARRLLVAGMACALVWQIARQEGADGVALRRLLVRLSGRQMGWGVEFTEPALLAGLWVLLAMLEALGQHGATELHRLAALVVPGPRAPNSG